MRTNGGADARWIEALAAASTASGGAPGTRLFHENRVDETIVATTADPPSGARSAWSGLSVDRDDRSVFLAGATPDDAALLVRRLGTRHPGPPARPLATAPPDFAIDASAGGRAAVAGALEALAGLGPRGEGRVRWTASRQSVHVTGAGEGGVVTDRRSGSSLRVEVRLGGRGRTATAVAECPSPGAVDGGRLAREASTRAAERRGARPAPRGERELVLRGGSAGVVLHELIGHAREGDVVSAGASWLTTDVTLAAALTVMDDPRRSRIGWEVDDEGTPATIVALVREGRVVGSLLDRASAAALETPSNGHARRSTYRERPMPRMGCTFAAAGRADVDELVSDVNDGVLVRRLEAGGTDPGRGVAWFRVTDADRLVRGRVTHPLRPFLLRVEGPRALTGVQVRVADDVVFDESLGHCLRRGQSMVTSVGAPTIWIGLGGYVF